MSESILKWVNEAEAKDAIADVRKDSTETNWTLISYEGPTGPSSQKLKLHSTGTGGIEELSESLKDDIIGFALLRETDKFDESITVKFVFINWVGESSPRMQRSRVSIHIGPIREWFGQFHVDINANSLSELSPEVVKSKIMDTSGSGSRVLSDTGRTHLSQQAQTTNVREQSRRNTTTKDDQLVFDSDKDLLKTFRSDNEKNWILYGYEEGSTTKINYIGGGSGNVTELLSHFNDNNVFYGLVKKIDRIDESDTIKFCFVQFTGDNINRMLRARLGTHSGAVKSFFAPYHVDLSATDMNEISDEIIESLIKKNSGTQSSVLADDKVIPSEKIVATKKVSNTNNVSTNSTRRTSVILSKPVNSDTIELDFENENDVRQALSSVRTSEGGINWALVTYNAPSKSKTLKLVGTGTGGIEEFIEKLDDSAVGYGLVRFIEQIDQSETVKFCFVNWVGDNIHRMQRAVLSTHRGFVNNLFQPFHVDLECTNKNEISSDIIMAKIKKASGTANFVLN